MATIVRRGLVLALFLAFATFFRTGLVSVVAAAGGAAHSQLAASHSKGDDEGESGHGGHDGNDDQGNDDQGQDEANNDTGDDNGQDDVDDVNDDKGHDGPNHDVNDDSKNAKKSPFIVLAANGEWRRRGSA